MISLNHLNAFFADATTAPASASTAATTANSAAAPNSAAQAPQQPGAYNFIFLLVIFSVMIYFLMIRPQSQQRKKLASMMEALKPGDKIVTASGIVGQVLSVKDKTVSIRSADAKMEITKTSVAEILERGEEKSAS